MKKDITNLINSEEGSFRINNIATLRRWTKSGKWCDENGNEGYIEKVDKLVIEFDNINHVCFSLFDREIKSRDYDGIITECQEKIQAFLSVVSEDLCKCLRAGYKKGAR